MQNPRQNYYHLIMLIAAFLVSAGLFMKGLPSQAADGSTAVSDAQLSLSGGNVTLGFHNDSTKTLDINLGVMENSGPTIQYNKSDGSDDIDSSVPEVKPEAQQKTISIKHDEKPTDAGLLQNIKDSITGTSGYLRSKGTGDEVYYVSSDGRVKDVYKTEGDTVKNTTYYGWGNGYEEESYTVDNAVLRMTDEGVIEGYYLPSSDLNGQSGTEGVDSGLLARAQRTIVKDTIEDLHTNGKSNPDFTIPAPFATDKYNNILSTLKYEITGETYNKIKVTFTSSVYAYPLTLDPTITITAPGYAVVIYPEGTGSYLGYSIVTGDLNADSRTDLIVGAYGYSGYGRVYIFYNNPNGFNSSASYADVNITGEIASGNFGYSLAIGDFDSNGTDDLIVGAPEVSQYGKVYIFYNDGLFPETADLADIIIRGSNTDGHFGCSIAVGNFENSGTTTDIAVGSKGGSSVYGYTYIFYQNAVPWTRLTTPCTTDCYASNADVSIFGGGKYSNGFGYSLAAGDFDNSSTTDLAVGYPGNGNGNVTIFYNDGAIPTNASSADKTITGESSDSYFGYSLAAGDFDNSSTTDLAVGATRINSQAGKAYIFYNDGSIPTTAATANVKITGESSANFFGSSLAALDFDNSGTTDLAIGAYGYSSYAGAVYIVYNDGSYPTSASNSDVRIGGESGSYLGRGGIAGGEFNYYSGGGIDIAIGADGISTNSGRVYIFYSTSAPTTPGYDSLTTSGMNLTWESGGGETEFYFGTVSDCSSGGEVVTSPQVISGLSANTAVTRYVCAIDPYDGTKSAALQIGPYYTAANTPVSPNYTNLTTSGMSLTWSSGGAQSDYAYGTTSSCSDGITSNTYLDISGLTANTSVTRYICARNGNGIKTSALQIGPFYTLASRPLTPVGSNPGINSIDVTPQSGGSEKDMAIYIAASSTKNCNGTAGLGYIQSDGSLNASPLWQTVAQWGTKTVTGLTGSTTYYVCAKARNGDNNETVFSPVSSATTLDPNNPAPSTSYISPESINGDLNGNAAGFTLTVNGSDFVSGSVIRWNGEDRTTTFVNSGQLTASITSADLTVYGTVPVTVFNPLPGGGVSNSQIFTVVDPAPAVTHFDPSHGSTDFSSLPSLVDVPDVKLANPAGAIQWTVPVTVLNQDLDSNVRVGTGYISINKAELDSSLDAPAHLSFSVLTCDSYKAYYASGYRSSLSEIKSAGQICNAGTTPACTNMACENNVLSFDVPHFDGYGGEGIADPDSKSIPTTLGVYNAAPSITAGPSDGGSSSATPTDEGDDVTFTATATDGNTDGYFLAVCATDSITANEYAPPSCAADQEICISTEADSGSPASCSFNTLGFTEESKDWYAFVCDYNTGSLCSLSSQGTGDSGSPFKVNHAGTFGTVSVTDVTDGTVEPGDTMKFTLASSDISDPDTDGTQDLLTMHICTDDTTAFDYTNDTCTGGTEICSSSPVDPTDTDASCTGGASLVSVPTAHGTYGFKVYVEDTHSLPAVGSDSQQYTVTDVPPVLVSYSASDTPAPAAGGSDTVDFSATIHDDNGDNDVLSANGVFYDDAAVDLDLGTCTSSENDCYLAPSCTLSDISTAGTGKTLYGTDNTLTVSCQVTVWFNADASSSWKAHVNMADSLSSVTSSVDSDPLTNEALLGIDVVQGSIAYGTVSIGGTSSSQESSMGNVGNQILDVYINGTDMTSSSYSIPHTQQKWSHSSPDFDWDAVPDSSGPFSLTDVASGTTDATGCLNRDIQVRPVHDSLSTNESVFWKLRIPASQQAGSYSGQNTFSTTAGDTCTGSLY